jgi:hypothetical protein
MLLCEIPIEPFGFKCPTFTLCLFKRRKRESASKGEAVPHSIITEQGMSSVLLRIGGFSCGLASGVTMYYLCVVQRMQHLQANTIDYVSAMERQLAIVANPDNRR